MFIYAWALRVVGDTIMAHKRILRTRTAARTRYLTYHKPIWGVMHKFKQGKLVVDGKKIKNHDQAVAIALSVARAGRKKRRK